MLASALRRYAWQPCPSSIFSSACCTPSPGNIAGDGRVFALAGNLVDLIDVDNAVLCQLLHQSPPPKIRRSRMFSTSSPT